MVANFLLPFTLARKKTSRKQVQDCLALIDKYYPFLTVSGSDERLIIKNVLFKLEMLSRDQASNCHDLHCKVIELAFRDRNLQINENEAKKDQLALEVEKMRKEVAKLTREF